MRLINVHTLELKEFTGTVPGYAILSHCWTDDEVSYKDFRKQRYSERSLGLNKIRRFCDGVKSGAFDGDGAIDWAWVDT